MCVCVCADGGDDEQSAQSSFTDEVLVEAITDEVLGSGADNSSKEKQQGRGTSSRRGC